MYSSMYEHSHLSTNMCVSRSIGVAVEKRFEGHDEPYKGAVASLRLQRHTVRVEGKRSEEERRSPALCTCMMCTMCCTVCGMRYEVCGVLCVLCAVCCVLCAVHSVRYCVC